MKKDSILMRMREAGRRSNSKGYYTSFQSGMKRRRYEGIDREDISIGKARLMSNKERVIHSPWESSALHNKLLKLSNKNITWNEIYSELVASLSGMGQYYRYLLDYRISWMVSMNILELDGELYDPEGYGNKLRGFYVYPKPKQGGVLYYAKPVYPSYKARNHQNDTSFLDKRTKEVVNKFEHGTWYKIKDVRYEPIFDLKYDNNNKPIWVNTGRLKRIVTWTPMSSKEMNRLYSEFPNARRHDGSYID